MKGKIIECYGCGGANCSMCSVYDSTSEVDAIIKTVQENRSGSIEYLLDRIRHARIDHSFHAMRRQRT